MLVTAVAEDGAILQTSASDQPFFVLTDLDASRVSAIEAHDPTLGRKRVTVRLPARTDTALDIALP